MRRVWFLILVSMLVLFIAGCGNEEPTPDATAEEAPPTEAPTAEVPPTEAPAEEVPAEEPTEESVAETDPEAVEDTTIAAQTLTQADIVDIVWQWTNFQDTAGVNNIQVPTPADYTITFRDNGTAEIKADCNNILAEYTIEGSSLTMILGPTTQVFCGEDSLDTSYVAFLSQVVSFVGDSEGNLILNLMADAGNMIFANSAAAPPVAEIEPPGIFCTLIEPANVIINTYGLPYPWQSNCVPFQTYDASQPPGPSGWPEHVQVNFGTINYAERQPTDPVLFIMPTAAYRAQWELNGDTTVSERLDRLVEIIAAEADDLPEDTPLLPVEEAVGARDIFVQSKYLDLGEWSGVRYVARYGQSPNPVTNENLRYVFQGFAGADNELFIAFFFPVVTSYLPNTAGDVTQEEMDRLNADVNAYMAERNEFLDSIGPGEWFPNLETLDIIIDSLEYTGDLPPGLLPPTEFPPPDTDLAYGRVVAPIGVNVRTGPGANYSIIGTAPYGAEGQIIGVSPDGGWWVTPVSGAPNNQGWVSAAYVEAFNVDNVPVIQPPIPPTPTPVPTVLPTPTPIPGPVINFWADRTTINQGECTHLRWDVQNVQAVWVYPMGSDYQSFPVTGSGARLECPATTTTYELRAQLYDGNLELRQVTIAVNPGNSLANTNWSLDTLNNQSLLPNTAISISFGNGGFINGFGGCNGYSGNYFVSGTAISISGVTSSQLFCDGGVSDQENLYLSLLQTSTTYELTGNQLILYDANGTATMRFLRS